MSLAQKVPRDDATEEKKDQTETEEFDTNQKEENPGSQTEAVQAVEEETEIERVGSSSNIEEEIVVKPIESSGPKVTKPPPVLEQDSKVSAHELEKQDSNSAQDADNITLRPSVRKHNGLSELSKQLRILQAKNQAQSIEIDRLERQLRILAELKGVDVSALRRSMEKACEAEAHDELQHRIAKLKAQLEAVQLAKQPASSVEDTAASNNIANYQLRVGELEEVEEKHKAQIKYLYDQLKEEKEKKTRLEAKCKQKETEIERLKESDTEKSVVMDNLGQMQGAQIQLLSDKATKAETEVQILLDRLKLSEQQRLAAEEQTKLRQAQYKARFMVQDERIKDLEQQLSSLYVAFGMIDEEHSAEDMKRKALQSNLDRADAEVARQVLALDQKETTTSFIAVSPEPKSPRSPPRSLKRASSRSVPTSPQPEYIKQANLVISGFILVRTTGMIKQWKHRHVALYSALSHHYLDMGEGKGHCLEFGISTVEPHHKMPFGFSILLNPDHSNTSICCAAENRQDFIKWMSALTLATSGGDYEQDSPVKREEITEQEAMELATVLNKSSLDL